MTKIAVSQLVFTRLERLAIGGRFMTASVTLLPDGRWEFDVEKEVLDQLKLVHLDPERALRILLGLPGGRDN